MAPPESQRKIAVMGYRSVGKSTLTIQFVEERFIDSYDPTIENTFNRVIKFRNRDYRLQLIDTAGQDEYSLMPRSYSVDIDGYVLVYAINSTKSFEVVKVIYDKVLDMSGELHVPMILVANKTDLHYEREISEEQGRQLANSWKAPYLEVTAKDSQGVKCVFEKILYEVEKASGNVKEDNKSCTVS